MLRFAPAKINIGLNITGKREDGFHDLISVALPVPFYDILELLPAKNVDGIFTQTGKIIEGRPEDNLVWKAIKAFRDIFPSPPVHIHLHKQIPSGAGLGGGSSDASTALLLMNELNGNPLASEKLHELAAQLGSDCPLFLYRQPSLMSGRGEKIEAINTDTEGLYLILLFPGFTISTKEAYQLIKPAAPLYPLKDLSELKVEDWKENISNDFETVLFPVYPALKEIKDELYRMGALYASMSGSGSAMYGLFKSEVQPGNSLSRYIIWTGWLS